MGCWPEKVANSYTTVSRKWSLTSRRPDDALSAVTFRAWPLERPGIVRTSQYRLLHLCSASLLVDDVPFRCGDTNSGQPLFWIAWLARGVIGLAGNHPETGAARHRYHGIRSKPQFADYSKARRPFRAPLHDFAGHLTFPS